MNSGNQNARGYQAMAAHLRLEAASAPDEASRQHLLESAEYYDQLAEAERRQPKQPRGRWT